MTVMFDCKKLFNNFSKILKNSKTMKENEYFLSSGLRLGIIYKFVTFLINYDLWAFSFMVHFISIRAIPKSEKMDSGLMQNLYGSYRGNKW